MTASSSMVPLGTQAPDFTLPDTSGTMTGRDDFTAAPALLVAFLCNHCPYVRHVETALGTLLSHYPDLAVVGICTNDADAYPGDRPHELAGQARRAGWNFPYLVDAGQKAGRAYHAARAMWRPPGPRRGARPDRGRLARASSAGRAGSTAYRWPAVGKNASRTAGFSMR